MSNTREWKIPVSADSTTAIFIPKDGKSKGVYVCAHGAGGHLGDRGMLKAGQAMLDAGLSVVRFNFLYKEHKSGRPDPMPKLMDTFETVTAHAKRELGDAGPWYIGGRSMGGRAASMLAAKGYVADGLILLAYPLHPPGQLDKLRDAHLPDITMPVLCFNGTRDEFCDVPLMKTALTKVKTSWTMHWLEAADHSFHVLKRSGRTDEDVLAEVTAATAGWLSTLG